MGYKPAEQQIEETKKYLKFGRANSICFFIHCLFFIWSKIACAVKHLG